MSSFQDDAEFGPTGLRAGDDILNGATDATGAGATRRRPMAKAVGTVEAMVAKAMGESTARRVRDSAEAAIGQAEAAIGQAESAYRSARFRVDRELANQPYKTLGIAVGVGVVIGLLVARRDRTIIYRPTH